MFRCDFDVMESLRKVNTARDFKWPMKTTNQALSTVPLFFSVQYKCCGTVTVHSLKYVLILTVYSIPFLPEIPGL